MSIPKTRDTLTHSYPPLCIQTVLHLQAAAKPVLRKEKTVTIQPRLLSILSGCLLTLLLSNQALAGASGILGGSAGNSFGTVYCPSSDQRIIGFKASVTNAGGNPLILGVSAICKGMDANGKWASGSNTTTKYQSGISNFPDDTEYSRTCPDHTWVAGITGGTRKAGNYSVLAELDVHCFSSTGEGKRTGSQETTTIVNQYASSAGNLYCPGGQIARGFYGKSGNYLDGVGLQCVQERAKIAAPRRRAGTVSTQFGWTRGFTQEEVQRFNLSVGNADSVAQLTGKDVQDVLTTANAVIRPDGEACIACHGGGSFGATFNASTTRQQACTELRDFDRAGKPDNLKLLFRYWRRGRCL